MGVDGQAITSVDDALRFYETLKSASDLKLQVQRRGRPLTLNYNFE
jgi:general secretion pathway protein C